MKLFFVIFCLGFISCKKNYQCSCNTFETHYFQNNPEPQYINKNDDYYYKTKKSSDAQTNCNTEHSLKSTQSTSTETVYTNVNCVIK